MFEVFKENKVALIYVKGSWDGDIKAGIQKRTWPELVTEMSKFVASEKKDVGMFLPVLAKPEQSWKRGESNLLSGKERSYRNQINFSHVTMAVLDLDEKGALEQAQKKFSGIEYVIHSTHSYSPETPYKYRMIMPLDNPVPTEQWERTFINLMAGINGDYSCKNISRGYYVPSVNPLYNLDPVYIHNEGKTLSLEKIMDLAERNMDAKAVDAFSKIDRSSTATKSESLLPSGESIEPKYRGEDLSYEGFFKRHKVYVDENFDGGKGNRHKYAMDVINREIGIFGEKARFDLLTKFIYKSTLEHSNSPLSTGNTGNEIPELVESAIGKMIPSESISDPQFFETVRSQIKKGLSESIDSEKTNEWSFESVVYEPKLLGNSLRSFKARYFREVAEFEKLTQELVESSVTDLKKGIISAFNQKVVTPVLQRELKGNTQFDIQCVGRFFFETMNEYGVGENPTSVYAGLAKKLSGYISGLNLPVIKDGGLTKESILHQLLEVTAKSPLLNMVDKENKAKFKKKNNIGQGTTHSPS
jgi:hypothetical protein